ncbi:P-loop containing nucleoside triphosphate hydrolase protein [Agrocybe pediades]|nr:P-loop containing nucleoside triphosphate hydrolase protein [Agrocybe pediades]
MQTRSTLGKRGHQDSSSPSVSFSACEQLQTPENTPNPKRARTTTVILDGDGNKENIPPFKTSPVTDPSPRAARALRRTATEAVTATRSRPAPRRHSSVSSLPATPRADISQLAIVTPPPTPPTVLLPFHARVRALLRSTCNNADAQIAGRTEERANIVKFLASFIQGTTTDQGTSPASMFISGTPGTGKTALVNEIIRELSSDVKDDIKIISINCMALKDVDALWTRMIEDFSVTAKGKSSPKKLKGRDGVRTLLSTLGAKCILILDELDHITPNTQSLSSIFTLTEALPSQLRLIGIANTHTLTSASSNGFLLSEDVATMHFAPYTPSQLQEILESRLKTLSAVDSSMDMTAAVRKFLPATTLMLLTKKVAALTGDVRSLFEVLRGAIDLAATSSAKYAKGDNPLDAAPVSVTPAHVLAALKAYTPAAASAKGPSTSPSPSNSETVTKIQNLGLQARLCLLTILLASKRAEAGLPLSSSVNASPRKSTPSPIKRSTSLPNAPTTPSSVGIEVSALHTYYTSILSRIESGLFEPVSRSEFGDLLGVLETNGVVSLSSSSSSPSLSASPTKARRTFGRSASFGASTKTGAGAVGEVRLVEGMWGDEVLRGLGVTATASACSLDDSDSREEEVKGIWEREKSRIAKDVKNAALASSKNSSINTFAGAFED